MTAFGCGLILLIAVALILKSRPAILIDTPRALLAISFAVSAALDAPMAVWWYRFDAPPRIAELLVFRHRVLTKSQLIPTIRLFSKRFNDFGKIR